MEKVLYILLLCVLLAILGCIFSAFEIPSAIESVLSLLCVTSTTMLYRTYVYHRNEHILKNINALLEKNQLQEAMQYINKWLMKHQKDQLIYAYQLYVVAMCGQITEFERMLYECERSYNYKRIIEFDFVKALKGITDFFKTRHCTAVTLNEPYWLSIMIALDENNHLKNIPILLGMYHTNFSMIKTVLAFKLYLSYSEINDIEKSEQYYNEALKYAPSAEIAYHIRNTKNKV